MSSSDYPPPPGYNPYAQDGGGGSEQDSARFAYQPDAPGPLGKVRPTGTTILLVFVTLGIYIFVYNYKVHSEMQRHSGRGVGGGIALLLTFIANVAMFFVTPAEVGSLYQRRNLEPPVRGWTGLWAVVPMFAGYVLAFVVTFVLAATVGHTEQQGDGRTTTSVPGAAIAAVFGVYVIAAVVGGIVWCVKTNGALNGYWELAARGRGAGRPQPPRASNG